MQLDGDARGRVRHRLIAVVGQPAGQRVEHDAAFGRRPRERVLAIDHDARAVRIERDRARETRRPGDQVRHAQPRVDHGARAALRDRRRDVTVERAGRIRTGPLADPVGRRGRRRHADVVAPRAGRVERVDARREVFEDRTASAAARYEHDPQAVVLQHDVVLAVGEHVGVPGQRGVGRDAAQPGQRHERMRREQDRIARSRRARRRRGRRNVAGIVGQRDAHAVDDERPVARAQRDRLSVDGIVHANRRVAPIDGDGERRVGTDQVRKRHVAQAGDRREGHGVDDTAARARVGAQARARERVELRSGWNDQPRLRVQRRPTERVRIDQRAGDRGGAARVERALRRRQGRGDRGVAGRSRRGRRRPDDRARGHAVRALEQRPVAAHQRGEPRRRCVPRRGARGRIRDRRVPAVERVRERCLPPERRQRVLQRKVDDALDAPRQQLVERERRVGRRDAARQRVLGLRQPAGLELAHGEWHVRLRRQQRRRDVELAAVVRADLRRVALIPVAHRPDR
ncbi:MAG TPA: hypothetical protein VMD91_00190 [Candidatus Sulfotelmatobacter sp.]|nr:hypothetical protein [Candidatus Sulfotelmatobacter sp.]